MLSTRTIATLVLIGLAILVGLSVDVGLESQRPTAFETEMRGYDQVGVDIQHIGDPTYTPTYGTPPDQSWPVDHARLSGLFAAAAVLVIGRLYLFMRRLESR